MNKPIYGIPVGVGGGNNSDIEQVEAQVARLSSEISELTGIIEGDSGEFSTVINDVVNNVAQGSYTLAVGSNTQAGCLGFRIKECKADNDGVTSLTTDQILDDGYYIIESSKAADEIKSKLIGKSPSIYLKTNIDNCGTVTAIEQLDNNQIKLIVDKYIHPNGWNTANKQQYYDTSYLFFVSEPNIGDIIIGDEAFASGLNSIAYNEVSHAEGRDTRAVGKYSHAEGRQTQASYAAHAEGYGAKATAPRSHAEGYNAVASGEAAHAEGQQTNAAAPRSHAEGYITKSTGISAHAEGDRTEAQAEASHAEGKQTIATGNYAHAEGYTPIDVIRNFGGAKGEASHTEGYSTTASGDYAHSEGYATLAKGAHSHAEGEGDKESDNYGNYGAHGTASHAEGKLVLAKGDYSHAEGDNTQALGESSHTEGRGTEAQGDYSHAEGYDSKTIGPYAHAEGYSTEATFAAHAEGSGTKAIGGYSHAEGYNTQALKDSSHAEGLLTKAIGNYSHAEGHYAKAEGEASHAEGHDTNAEGNYSHAEGDKTVAIGNYAHAEGYIPADSIRAVGGARGEASHSEGWNTAAIGKASHAEGELTKALADAAHAGGIGTIANVDAQTVIGTYNATDADALFIVGNGEGEGNQRSNAFKVNKDGTATVGKEPVNNMDVVPLKILNKEISTVQTNLGSDITHLQTALCCDAQPKTYETGTWVDGMSELYGNLYYILVKVDNELISFGVHMLAYNHDNKGVHAQIWNVRGDGSGNPKCERLTYFSGTFQYAFVNIEHGGLSYKSATIYLYPIRTAGSYT